MLKIGITGGIGSGKSTVCDIFLRFGIPVYNADLEAKKLLENREVIEFYRNEFGNDVFKNNQLDKHKIASVIFENSAALQKVNDFIHPLVKLKFEAWCETFQNEVYVLEEAALIFESGSYNSLDATIFVHAPQKLRIKRVVERDDVTQEMVMQRIKNQWPDQKKIKLANYIISNDEHSLLLPQVLRLHQMFISEKQIKK
jgi:dephospho-CoA kinase